MFATGQSIESTIGAGYQTVHNAIANTNNQPGVEVFGLESYSALNNFNLGTRVSDSAPADQQRHRRPSIFSEFTALSKEARLIVNAMDALDDLNKATASTSERRRRIIARAVVRLFRRRRVARLAGDDLRLGGHRDARACRTIRFRR